MTILSSSKGVYEIKPVGYTAKYTVYEAGINNMLIDTSCNGMHIMTADKAKVKEYQKQLDAWLDKKCKDMIKHYQKAASSVGGKWDTVKKNAIRQSSDT